MTRPEAAAAAAVAEVVEEGDEENEEKNDIEIRKNLPPMNCSLEKLRKDRRTNAREANRQETERPRQQTAIATAVVHEITNDVVCWPSDARQRTSAPHTTQSNRICENNTPLNGIST